LAGADFKIIFLDEADSLTSDAQAALRRTMERYSATCRFILSCNYSSRIIPPIQSRCSVMRFSPLTRDEIRTYVDRISAGEGLTITEEGFETLLYISEGDLRKTVNILQVAASYSKKIDQEALFSTAAIARPEQITEMLQRAVKGNFTGAREVLLKLVTEAGLSGEDILGQIHREIYNIPLSDEVRVRLLDAVGEADFRMIEGADERIQLEALLARIQLLSRKSP
jgi:replication factor C small subunit